MEKICKTCRLSKPLEEFSPHPHCKYGRASSCKPCRVALNRESYLKRNAALIAQKKQERKQRQETAKKRLADARRTWRMANRKKCVEYSNKWRERNREQYLAKAKLRAHGKTGRHCDPEKQRAVWRSYYHRHREELAAKRSQCREFVNAKNKKWREDNPERWAAISAAQRARRARTQCSFTASEWAALKEKYGHACLRCGSRESLTADHVIPLSKGGAGSIDNIQPLCKPCNSSKHTKIIDFRPQERTA